MINMLGCTSTNIIPILMVVGDYEKITEIAWKEDNLSCAREFAVTPIQSLALDQGGPVLANGSKESITVDGAKLNFYLSNISRIIYCLEKQMENSLKIKRIMLDFSIMLCTEEFAKKLLQKLTPYKMDDRVLNESLSLDEGLESSAQRGSMIRVTVPYEIH